jgi:cytochrome c oxidase subunit 2
VGKWWSILFAVIMLACGLSFVVAPFVGWWLPEGVSSHAWHVDRLFYVILGITGFFFFLTEGLLVYFMFVYARRPVAHTADATLPPPLRAAAGFVRLIPRFLHHEHRVEMAWTIVPAIILLYIAFAQVTTWAEIKYQSRAPQYEGLEVPLQVSVSARQFEWRLRYPSTERVKNWLNKKNKLDFESFARKPQFDDVHAVNELHVWKGQPVIVHLTTRDVIHSFNLPHFRVKQDALPGREIPVWFTPTKANTVRGGDGTWLHGVNPATKAASHEYDFDLPCAELCGWGHYRMIGKVYVHETQQDFLDWLAGVERYQAVPQGEQKAAVQKANTEDKGNK